MHTFMRALYILSVLMLIGVKCASAETEAERKAVSGIVFECGGGQVVTIDGETSAKITDSYIQGAKQGKNFVFKNMGAIFAGLPPDKAIEAFKIFTDCIDRRRGTYHPDYDEPSQDEMHGALDNSLLGRSRKEDGSYVVDNPISGFRINILQFHKQDCRVSVSGSGYDCTYTIQTGESFFSKETSQAGRDHANALNQLSGYFGGQVSRPEVVLRRFIKTEQGWVMSVP